LTPFRMIALIAEIILGYLTLTGSLMAAGKLQEVKWVPQRPVTYPLQNISNLALFGLALALAGAITRSPTAAWAPFVFGGIIALALLFGVLLIIPIGGADMPTVIAILNSYAGLSAVAMGFVLDNKLLITAGALDGSSGLILAIIMCNAMNRSFMNVLLAEADIPYTDLVEMDEINPDMPQVDVALVVGANDVVNPAARTEKASPIYGMPIIDADKARSVFAIKRSKNPGFAGIDNELYFGDCTWMLFGDAKNVIGELVKQLAGGSGMH